MLLIVRAGPSELFRGFLASSLRDAPYAGLFLVFYEAFKRDAASVLPPSSPLVYAALNSGSAAAAATFATLATQPFDVVKVSPVPFILLKGHRALTPFGRQGCKFAVKINTVALSRQSWLCGKSALVFLIFVSFLTRLVFKERGIHGFFDGASLRLSRKIFSSAIGWAVYESLLVFARTKSR